MPKHIEPSPPSDARQRLRLSADELYRRCDPSELGFETTAEIPPVDGTVGQDRALDALQFGLEIGAEGYNVYVAGPPGTGRNSTLQASVRRVAASGAVAPDWAYVYNFVDSHQPSLLSLPAGRGRALAVAMDAMIAACRREIPGHFDSAEYAARREELGRQLQEQREQVFSPVEEEARKLGFALNVTPMGVATVPLKEDGQPMAREEFAALPEDERKALQDKGESLQSPISQALMGVRRLEKEAQQKLGELDRAVTLFAITPLLNEVRQEYMDIAKALDFLEQVQDDIVAHIDAFRPQEQQQAQPVLALPRPPIEEFFGRYKVNVIVSHEGETGAPVVIENKPTYYNLFGRVDYGAQFGAMTTDHTMIKAGALHRANGGYLILQALDIFTNYLIWDTLKRTIRAGEIRIENLGEQYSAIPVSTLTPQPIPLSVKLIFVGDPMYYHLLYQQDEDFRKLFRAKADFTTDMPRSPECVRLYGQFVSTIAAQEKLRPFERAAVARVVEHGSRLAENQGRLSTRFIEVSDLLTEADFWASKAGGDVVQTSHVEQAIEHKIYRSNLIEERVQDTINEGTIMIDTAGQVAGQVNGLAVYQLGDYRFGRPSRITARVSLGRGQVVSIDRENQLSGKLHNKGFTILSGYLNGKYATERALSFAATIGFEQTYNEVDGDSASSTELYVLLSALSGLPIEQGIAVTGSIDQRGEIQPIGGVNEKIEGFFAVCKAQGLSGNQGVLIPRTNARHLMLNKEVVDAVINSQFHVWAVASADEGIEVLTGVPAGVCDARGRYPPGTVNRRVMDSLARMARRSNRRDGRDGTKRNSATEEKATANVEPEKPPPDQPPDE